MPKKDSKDTKEVDMRVQEKGIDAHRVSGLTVAFKMTRSSLVLTMKFKNVKSFKFETCLMLCYHE